MRKTRVEIVDVLNWTEEYRKQSDRRERLLIALTAIDIQYEPPAPPPPVPAPTGRVLVLANLQLNDHEDWEADEHSSYSNLGTWADVDQSFVERMQLEGRCGGEVRLELHLICGINEADRDLLEFQVIAQLYEGTSTSTNDLDGTEYFYIQIPRGESRTLQGLVTNKDENEPDDRGWFFMRIEFQ